MIKVLDVHSVMRNIAVNTINEFWSNRGGRPRAFDAQTLLDTNNQSIKQRLKRGAIVYLVACALHRPQVGFSGIQVMSAT